MLLDGVAQPSRRFLDLVHLGPVRPHAAPRSHPELAQSPPPQTQHKPCAPSEGLVLRPHYPGEQLGDRVSDLGCSQPGESCQRSPCHSKVLDPPPPACFQRRGPAPRSNLKPGELRKGVRGCSFPAPPLPPGLECAAGRTSDSKVRLPKRPREQEGNKQLPHPTAHEGLGTSASPSVAAALQGGEQGAGRAALGPTTYKGSRPQPPACPRGSGSTLPPTLLQRRGAEPGQDGARQTSLCSWHNVGLCQVKPLGSAQLGT